MSSPLIAEHIREHGWHVVLVMGDERAPPFGYTVGLHASFASPELLVLGLNEDLQAIHWALNALGSRAREGHRFEAGGVEEVVLGGFSCPLAGIPRDEHSHHLGQALDFYRDEPFAALQWVWPDPSGLLPWDDEAGDALQQRQPWVGRYGDVPFPYPWPFTSPRSLLCEVSASVLDGAPVGHAARAGDEHWIMLRDPTESVAGRTSLGRLVARQPRLAELSEWPIGKGAAVVSEPA